MTLTYHPFKNAKNHIMEKPHYDFLLEYVERKKSENICRKDIDLHNFSIMLFNKLYILE